MHGRPAPVARAAPARPFAALRTRLRGVVIGASMSLGSVIDFSDAMIFAMAIANIIGLYMLMPEVKALLKDYHAKLASGEIRKVEKKRFSPGAPAAR